MSGNTRKRNGGFKSPNDFKRLKAKVGKRAPRAASTTDTDFKARSLRICGQGVRTGESAESVVSGRGRSLAELLSQYNHPAAVVRQSAMKGLSNVVVNLSHETLAPYLVTILPACAKSFVDEDQNVRIAGIAAYSSILSKMDYINIRPFVPLVVAFISSALNSLDSSMQVDGARTVGLLAIGFPSLTKPFVPKLLPPFTVLLADPKSPTRRDELLQALVALLRVSVVDCDRSQKFASDGAGAATEDGDIELFQRDHATPCILVESPKYRKKRPPELSVGHLPTLARLAGDAGPESSQQTGTRPWSYSQRGAEVLVKLLEKLRDFLVETLGVSFDRSPAMGSSDARFDSATIITVLEVVRLLWDQHVQNTATRRLSVQMMKVLLDGFPISADDVRGCDLARIRAVNVSICATTMALSTSVSDSEAEAGSFRPEGTLALVSYILPEVVPAVENQSYPQILNVFCRLVMLVLASNDLTSEATAGRLFKTLHEAYNLLLTRPELARSPNGLDIVLLLIRILSRKRFCLEQLEQFQIDVVMEMLTSSPKILQIWRTDFLIETTELMECMKEAVRGFARPDRESLCASWRASFSRLCAVSESRVEGVAGCRMSVLEQYPRELRRRFLGLLVAIRHPPKEMIEKLAAVCIRSGRMRGVDFRLTSSPLEDILEAAHIIRKDLSLQDYLKFLVKSIGIPGYVVDADGKLSSKSNALDMELIRSVDAGLGCVSRMFLRCGSASILPKLAPQIRLWLRPKSGVSSSMAIVRSRAAAVILATISIDTKRYSGCFTLFCGSECDLFMLAAEGIAKAVLAVAPAKLPGSLRDSVLAPYVALMSTEPKLIGTVFSLIDRELTAGNPLIGHDAETLIQILIELVNDKRLEEAIVGSSEALASARAITLRYPHGLGRQLGAELCSTLETKVKIQTPTLT